MAKKRKKNSVLGGQQLKPALPKVFIWTDGACWPNPNGWGGWAAIIQYDGHEKIVTGAAAKTTNNRMEIAAALGALSILTEPCDVTIYADSQYLVKTMNGRWRKHMNRDLWSELEQLRKPHVNRWIWIKGHATDVNNIRADELAGKAREAFRERHADITVIYEPLPSMEYPRA